jgi:hypothetical protein
LEANEEQAVMTILKMFWKGATVVNVEILAFQIHLNGITAHEVRKKLKEESERGVFSHQVEKVRFQVEKRMMGAPLEKEIEWKRSPLFYCISKIPQLTT